MPRYALASHWQLAPLPDLVRALTRALGWLSALCCILMMALGDPQFRLPPLTAARVTIHDAFCLGLSMGDIIMILLLNFRGDYKDSTLDLYRQAARAAYQSPPREKWLGVAVWSLTLMA
ncbi:hypothetical protein CDD80_6853 [Ophiocordyceps camponoti-rufipedis]|uniref:Uncharacterized protein n=1 Tax=Ophiocordyceps camponoti-rufipedis TaxID=2004952 RepID=A0A2C5ZEJ1_9HYPO|nr:hypothetical protein CDD80_6853 [Ophiocordyceps camponoti-rufipedis]